MAIKEFIEGTWSRKYEYVDVCRDDYSCRKRFKYREEEILAEDYYNHLQFLDDQANTLKEQRRAANEQKRTADELEALRKATEGKNRREQERPYRPPFYHSSNQFYDPEYKEWLRYKKETDPEFKKWKFFNDVKARKLEEERRRAAEVSESARKEQERKFREKKEAELRPYEEDMLSKKKVACTLRVKVAKETSREEVMIRCVRDPAVSVFNALKQNPNLTPKVQSMIAKKETPPVYSQPTNNSPIEMSSPALTNDEEGLGCWGWFLIIGFSLGIILYILFHEIR